MSGSLHSKHDLETYGEEVSMKSTAVVGAGVIGLLSAWQLRLSGHAVTIIAPEIGKDASYAAAGMLAPISEVQYGQQSLWPIMTAARAEYTSFLATLSQAVDVPTGYRDNGTILLAADPSDRAAVADLVAVQQQHGMEVTPLPSSELRRREPGLAPGVSKGWEVPSDHQVDPRQLVDCAITALEAELSAEAFPEAGPPAEWINATVTGVEIAGEGSADLFRCTFGSADRTGEVSTAVGSADDDHADYDHADYDNLLLAPGLGYSRVSGLPEAAPLDLRPIHGDVLRLRVRPEQLLPGEKHVLHATVRAKVAGRSVYLVPRADGGLVIGASSREDGMEGTHAGSVQELLDDAVAVLPAVKDMELEEITTRPRPGTPDERPYLGELKAPAAGKAAGRAVVSTGYSRHGILLAPLAARLSAALLNGEDLSDDDASLLAAMDLAR